MARIGQLADYYCQALPNSPREAVALAEAELEHRRPESVTLVGSSLGGFYATYLAEKHGWKAVLVNPAVHAHKLLRAALGPQTNWHTGESWVLTEAHLNELAALDVEAITRRASRKREYRRPDRGRGIDGVGVWLVAVHRSGPWVFRT